MPSGTSVRLGIHLGRVVGVVPGTEGIILLLIVEQGGHGVHCRGGLHALLQLFQHILEGSGGIVGGAQGCTHGGEAVAVLGEDGVVGIQLQGVHKALPQTHKKVEGTAQKDDLALQLPALGQTGHRLIHHGLEDRGGHVLLPPALVQNGLDVALGKHAAPGGDGVDLLVL